MIVFINVVFFLVMGSITMAAYGGILAALRGEKAVTAQRTVLCVVTFLLSLFIIYYAEAYIFGVLPKLWGTL